MNDATRILKSLQVGQLPEAADLFMVVYEELRRIAASKLCQESPGQTLQLTALVHEAWLRLGGEAQPVWQNRAHFFAAAGEAMRRILIEKARRRQRIRHGGELERVDFDAVEIVASATDERLLRIHEALDRFAQEDPPRAEVVRLNPATRCQKVECVRVSYTTDDFARRADARCVVFIRCARPPWDRLVTRDGRAASRQTTPLPAEPGKPRQTSPDRWV